MCPSSWNLGASTSWNPQGLSRPVMGLLYLSTSQLLLRGTRSLLATILPHTPSCSHSITLLPLVYSQYQAFYCSTQRQARELISGPDLATRARLLSFNRTQSRVVIGLLTEHNTLRRHLYVMELSNNPICRKCGNDEETSAHILWVRGGLGFTQIYISGFLLFGPWGYQETKCRGHLELC